MPLSSFLCVLCASVAILSSSVEAGNRSAASAVADSIAAVLGRAHLVTRVERDSVVFRAQSGDTFSHCIKTDFTCKAPVLIAADSILATFIQGKGHKASVTFRLSGFAGVRSKIIITVTLRDSTAKEHTASTIARVMMNRQASGESEITRAGEKEKASVHSRPYHDDSESPMPPPPPLPIVDDGGEGLPGAGEEYDDNPPPPPPPVPGEGDLPGDE